CFIRGTIKTTILSTISFYITFFFFTVPPSSSIYTLSLHDALPISLPSLKVAPTGIALTARDCSELVSPVRLFTVALSVPSVTVRSEEHTSELQSLAYLVCRLLLEKKKKKKDKHINTSTNIHYI